jgi:hypothetical protein
VRLDLRLTFAQRRIHHEHVGRWRALITLVKPEEAAELLRGEAVSHNAQYGTLVRMKTRRSCFFGIERFQRLDDRVDALPAAISDPSPLGVGVELLYIGPWASATAKPRAFKPLLCQTEPRGRLMSSE